MVAPLMPAIPPVALPLEDAEISQVAVSTTMTDTSTTVKDFDSISVGYRSSGKHRHFGVSVMWRDSSGGALSSATVNGVDCTLAGQFNDGGASNTAVLVTDSPVDEGDSIDVSLTFAADPVEQEIVVVVHKIEVTYGYTFSSTPSDTGTDAEPNPAAAMDCPAGGVILGACAAIADTTCTWVGVTEDTDTVYNSLLTASTGSEAFSSAQTSLTVSCSPSGAESSAAGVFASFANAS